MRNKILEGLYVLGMVATTSAVGYILFVAI